MYKLIYDELSQTVKLILRLEDGAHIPFNENNKDYQKYLKWLEEGNTPLPAEGTE